MRLKPSPRKSAGNHQTEPGDRVAPHVTAAHSNGTFAVEWWPVERVIPYARNARKIPPSAVAKVAASIQEFGWRQPIVVDADGVIVCGHARLLGAQQLKLAQVPVHVAADLTPAQVKAYRLMDNRSHLEAAWDDQLLSVELGELQGVMDLNLTGFDAAEIDRVMGAYAVPEPSDAPMEDRPVIFCVIIECPDEAQQVELLKELSERGLECRALM